ncbi:MAG: HAD family hydrolase [Spirochaetales bacterium]|nr:HAD family hydrolase [Spirochaetales bacterium]
MIKDLVFDLDGTLWDATECCAAAWVDTLAEIPGVRRDISREDIQGICGMQHSLAGERLFPSVDENRRNELLALCYLAENRYLKQRGGRLYPDCIQVLETLSSRYNLYIVSNCQAGYIESFYYYHKTKKYFKDHECSGNTGLAKDRNIRMLMDRNGIDSTIYLGDTEGDAEAARAVGIPFVYASYGFGESGGAEEVISSLSDLVSIAGRY